MLNTQQPTAKTYPDGNVHGAACSWEILANNDDKKEQGRSQNLHGKFRIS